MRTAAFTFAFMLICYPSGSLIAKAQAPNSQGVQVIDGVAVRIEDDIITESEVQELSRFQQLVDGNAQARGDVVRELVDQWIVRNEANTTKYPMPSTEDVQRQYDQLAMQFHSADEFKAHYAAVGLGEAAVRQLLTQQLFLSRFLDYRFRPAAQIEQEQIEKYYNDEFVPQLKARIQAVPPLDSVADTIREILVQRAINDKSTKWLNDTRSHLRIDISKESGS